MPRPAASRRSLTTLARGALALVTRGRSTTGAGSQCRCSNAKAKVHGVGTKPRRRRQSCRWPQGGYQPGLSGMAFSFGAGIVIMLSIMRLQLSIIRVICFM